MYLHWLIYFLASMWRLSDAEACNSTQYAEAKIQLWKNLSLEDNDPQNERMFPLMYNYKYQPYYADQPADIYVDIYVTSIINVNEKAQSLTTQVKMITTWPNFLMKWNPDDYCRIRSLGAQKNLVWTPDINIKESIKTDFGTKESTDVVLLSNGYTVSTDILALTTACKMDLYKFPFDTQNCNITLQSTVYSDKEIQIHNNANYRFNKSKEFYQNKGEWNLTKINTRTRHTTNDDDLELLQMHQLIYEITIQRRPALYIMNILVPVSVFLLLDLFSFFVISDISDKVTFKVTLLLSVSVMLLILSNTLPSTWTDVPLIGVYCGVIFILIGISMMETILMKYLKAVLKNKSEKTDKQNPPDSVSDQNGETYSDEDKKRCCTLDCLMKQNYTGPDKAARILNLVFLVLYIITIIVFMAWIWAVWYYS